MSNVAKMNDVLNPPWARIAARQRFHPVDDQLGGAATSPPVAPDLYVVIPPRRGTSGPLV
jgi:hypothetical protein